MDACASTDDEKEEDTCSGGLGWDAAAAAAMLSQTGQPYLSVFTFETHIAILAL